MEERWKKIPEFPLFKDLSIDDKPLFDLAFQQFPPVISEFTFTNLFIWRHAYQTKISRFDQFLCLLSDQGQNPFFFPTIGKDDVVECYEVLLNYLKEKGVAPRVARLPEEAISGIDWEAAGMVAELDRDQSDYVYLVEDLVQLKGRKYHRKRNHIKQFKESHSYRYVPLASEWVPECLRLQTQWCDLRQCEAIPGLARESLAIQEACTHFNEIGVKGAAIVINGKVEAFTFGEALNPETVVIHIEKANPGIEGIYTMIHQAFLENEWVGYTYVNREQDLGEEGLRKAKESYFPHHLAHKYTLTLK